MIIGGEYSVERRTVEDLNLVLMIEEELAGNFEGGQTIVVNGGEFVLWDRTVDRKNRTVKYKLMPTGETE